MSDQNCVIPDSIRKLSERCSESLNELLRAAVLSKNVQYFTSGDHSERCFFLTRDSQMRNFDVKNGVARQFPEGRSRALASPAMLKNRRPNMTCPKGLRQKLYDSDTTFIFFIFMISVRGHTSSTEFKFGVAEKKLWERLFLTTDGPRRNRELYCDPYQLKRCTPLTSSRLLASNHQFTFVFHFFERIFLV